MIAILLSSTLGLPGRLRLSWLDHATDEQIDDAIDDEEAVDQELADEDDEAGLKKKSGGQTTQLAVIGGCALVAVACLFGSGSGEPAEERELSFAEVVTQAVDDEKVPPKLLQRLQHAERAWCATTSSRPSCSTTTFATCCSLVATNWATTAQKTSWPCSTSSSVGSANSSSLVFSPLIAQSSLSF